MTPDRWQQIEKWYNAVIEQGAVTLENVPDDLRNEVRALIARTGAPAESPGSLRETQTVLVPGAQIGPYRIEASLGQGGMGQVFLATDTRLDRKVAIKTSHSTFAPRFQREASAIARLNHPNVCVLYDVGPDYIVMEFCDGETLADRIKRGALPLPETLKIGSRIAAALAAAHAKGIVHRDLKPANIILTKTGPKVLDFGLAKSSVDETLTGSNVVLGTPAYMAPEQREGKACDARTDVYALGLVLAEMATGKRGSQENLPAGFDHVIERCLSSEPDERWQSAADVGHHLDWLARKPQLDSEARPRHRRSALAAWLIAGLALAAAGFAIFKSPSAGPGGAAPLPAQFSLVLDSLSEPVGLAAVPIPSPDGRFLAYSSQDASGHRAIWLRRVAAAEAHSIPGTENGQSPFWSPDSRWIGFFADSKVKKVSPDGGAPQSIAALTTQFQEPVWGRRGDILFRPLNREPLFRIPDSGGPAVQVTTLDTQRTENSHRGQQFLPDGRRFLFVARCAERAMNALYLGSLDTGKTKRLMQIDSVARYITPRGKGPGLVLYHRDGALVARRLNLDREEVEGDPVVVFDRVGFNPTGLGVDFRSSSDGRLAILRTASPDRSELAWYSRSGLRQATLGEVGSFLQARLSPDGSRVVYAGVDPDSGNRDLFTLDVARPIPTRLTTDVANDWFPVWSPGGKDLVFVSDRRNGGMFSKSAGASEAPETLINSIGPEDWSRDGQWIAGYRDRTLWVSKSTPGSVPVAIVPKSKGASDGIRFSPDTKWISYLSDDSGLWQVYVRPFQGAALAGPAIQITREGGTSAIWNPLGGELFFVSRDGALWSVNTRDLGRAPVPEPSLLFRLCESPAAPVLPFVAAYTSPFDTIDGKRFLVACAVQPPNHFTVLMNWKFPD